MKTLETGGCQIRSGSITTKANVRMNLSKPLRSTARFLHVLFLRCRSYLPRQRCPTFAVAKRSGIGPIYVINLDRQPNRWLDMIRELSCILDAAGEPLSNRVIRYSACDGQLCPPELLSGAEVNPFYTLGEQLFVEPQPHAIPDEFDLERPIRLTRSEIAVARSHIGVWRAIAQSSAPYALVLEDDVWFERGFGRTLQRTWHELEISTHDKSALFDVLYVSYQEARFGAPKELLSSNVFRPERGLWHLSGYVLSKRGAQSLLGLLPCRGPVDLWINHKFGELNVRALRRSVVNQRRDLPSTNSYSILPTLSRIGVLDGGDAALFRRRPSHFPVFAFGVPGSGLSSLAMALSMLGYRCCSDFDEIPDCEFTSLLGGHTNRIFDAYVNIDCLAAKLKLLIERYPTAKYIWIEKDCSKSTELVNESIREALEGRDVLYLHRENSSSWRALCEHLKLAPPDAPYPVVRDVGVRKRHVAPLEQTSSAPFRQLRHDTSPWVVNPRAGWAGITTAGVMQGFASPFKTHFADDFTQIDPARWLLRNDTFPGNLGLFRPANVNSATGGGLSLTVIEEALGVRGLGAAAISTNDSFLFGRFEATLRATNVSGIVTGFFLHRDSPRQEIDVEIRGNRPDQLLVNVFYNPGTEGAKFDYGYRGTPTVIDLGFDASKALHRFTIEWEPCEIRWFVDHKLVHRRAIWGPTPIPHLPMKLHINTWPSSSREFAGRLARGALPVSATLHRVLVDTYEPGSGSVQINAEDLEGAFDRQSI